MALLKCAACEGQISDTAVTCVHCGNVLQKQKPGVVGIALRVIYGIFTIGIIALAVASMADRTLDAGAKAMVPVVLGGIWFAVSLGVAALLYVTRGGRLVRVAGAVKD